MKLRDALTRLVMHWLNIPFKDYYRSLPEKGKSIGGAKKYFGT
jgi:hypothetical protein